MWITFLPLLSLSSLPPIKVDEKKILLSPYFFFPSHTLLYIILFSLYKRKVTKLPPLLHTPLTSLMTNECFICIYARALVCVCALRFYLIKEALSFSLSRFFSFGIEFFIAVFFSGLGLYSQKGGSKKVRMQVRRFSFPSRFRCRVSGKRN